MTREDNAPTPRSSQPHRQKTASHAVHPEAVAAKRAPSSDHPPIRLTHPDKILDAESSLTKQALADYYWAIAVHMLPHIAGRPLSLVRCPEGSGKPCFFQKHVTAMLPKGIGSIEVPDKKTGKLEPYITLDDERTNPDALASLAQLGVLEVHPWGSRNDDLEHPDRLIFDLDPDESLVWSTVTEAAADIRARLKRLGLIAFLKTTGGKGLHVVIPIGRDARLDYRQELRAMPSSSPWRRPPPASISPGMTKAARTGKIYLDYLRNERGATAVAAYSPRARSGCAVSMPLEWSELDGSERPIFGVANFADWHARISKDPWKTITSTRQSITRETLAAVGVKAQTI